jgi:Uma2 family endonuclease
VEILSPGTRKVDETIKRKLYERFDVRDYCVIDPELDTVKIYRRAEGAFVRAPELAAEQRDTLTTPLLPDFSLSLPDLFASPG